MSHHSTSNKLIMTAIPVAFILVGILFTYAGIVRNARRAQENHDMVTVNQFYNRVVACLASQSPANRTPEYTKECYDEVERQLGIKADRYGTAK